MQPVGIRCRCPGACYLAQSQNDTINSSPGPLQKRGCAEGKTDLRNGICLAEQNDMGRAGAAGIGGKGKVHHAVGNAADDQPHLVAGWNTRAIQICRYR